MDRRTATQTLAQNLSAAMMSTGATPESVAEATDVHPSTVRAALNGQHDITVTEMVAMSVAFSVSAPTLLEGVAA